jgi:hypothetical protein
MVALVMLEQGFGLIGLGLPPFWSIEAIVGRGEHGHNCDHLKWINI